MSIPQSTDADQEFDVPVTMSALLLLSGCTYYDPKASVKRRDNAQFVFDELLACAVAAGFSEADRLCALLKRLGPILSRTRVVLLPVEVLTLANFAFAHMPTDTIRAALVQGGLSDPLMEFLGIR